MSADAAREDMLACIRIALDGAPRPPVDVPRSYRIGGSVPAGDETLVNVFVERLVDYRAGVRRTDGVGLADAVAEALAAGLARRAAGAPRRPRVVVPPGLHVGWLRSLDGEVVTDTGLDAAALDDCDAVVTAARVAIAETGTIVLDAGRGQGRRSLTLIPDVHVCVVTDDQVVANVPDAMPTIEPTRPLTWISGPSATSDIELDRVEGVHGPRILEVVIAKTGA